MVGLRGNVTYQLAIKWDGAVWTDETARMKEFAIERGFDENLRSMQAGTLALVMKDTTGRFNPANAASPLQPYITYPLREVRLRATYASTTYYLFSGYTRRHEADPGRDAREARLDCIDAFVLLDGVRPATATGSTTGAAIDAILDDADFTGVRGLDVGDAITFAADGGTEALQHIADLLTAERGFFFFRATGAAAYFDRHWPNRAPYTSSQGTIASTMRAIAPAVDLDAIRNRATVTKTGGTAQTASDAASIALFKTRDFPAIKSDYLASDAAAASLAAYQVLKAKDPLPTPRYLDLNNGQATAFAQLLTRELGDRVTVTESLGGTSGDYHIRRITHQVNWSRGIHRGSWTLERRDTIQPFLIGYSTIGGTDVITY